MPLTLTFSTSPSSPTNRPTVWKLADHRSVYNPPVNDLRVERGRATRERLIAAGRELFGSHGYEATSIEAVLERAGVKRGGLYHHFDSKKSLFDAVLDRVVADISDDVA